jgi:hypothetical protein
MAARTRRSSTTFSRNIAPFAPLALAMAVGAGMTGPSQAPEQGATPPAAVEMQGGFSQACTSPQFPIDTATAMDKSSCTVAGNGGDEANQNMAKNNFCGVGSSNDPATPITTTMKEMIDLQAKAQAIPGINFGNPFKHPLTSKPGPVQDRQPLQQIGEGSLVQLIGYVKKARQEGAENVNCKGQVPNSDEYHDIHISIVLSPADEECAGLVAEMTPHHRPPEWTADHANAVATAGLLVRITGQRMFDSSHTPCISGSGVGTDPKRLTLWEVHPIYKFEVCPQGNCESGGWLPLEAWKKS